MDQQQYRARWVYARIVLIDTVVLIGRTRLRAADAACYSLYLIYKLILKPRPGEKRMIHTGVLTLPADGTK
jgi:hypothetical protein